MVPDNIDERIRLRILIPVGIALLTLLSASVVGVYWLHRVDEEKNIWETAEAAYRLFQSSLSKDAGLMDNAIYFLERDSNLQEAWIARDREALQKIAQAIFHEMRSNYPVTHFYFIDMDGTCFLRVHQPMKHGDIINRFTLKQAASGINPSRGIELGPLGTFALRVVHPWWISGKLAGYIELAGEIEHLSLALSKTLGIDLLIFIHKKHLNRPDWEEGMKMLERQANWEEYPDSVLVNQTTTDIVLTAGERKTLLGNGFRPLKLSERPNHRFYGAAMIPLMDAAQRRVGEMIIFKDVTASETAQWNLSCGLVLLFSLIGVAFMGFFYFYLGRIGQKLVRNRGHLRTR
jgi:hypothetical protein